MKEQTPIVLNGTRKRVKIITYVLLNPDISFYENRVDPGRLAAKERDKDPYCFPNKWSTG